MRNITSKTNEAVQIDSRRMRRRMAMIRLGVCLILLLLLAKIAYIKIVQGKLYETYAVIQSLNGSSNTERVLKPIRGEIRDRNNTPLAVSKTVYDIILDVKVLKALDAEDKKQKQPKDVKTKILTVTAKKLGIDLNELERKADDPQNENSNYVKIARGVSLEKRNEIMDYAKKGFYYEVFSGQMTEEEAKAKKIKLFFLNCIYDEMIVLREYPLDTFAPHVIGFTLPSKDSFGLERSYDSVLSGKPGRQFRTYTTDGYPIMDETPSVPGNTLVTTLDSTIQNYAQSIADKALTQYMAQHTSMIVMDPDKGEILAMAQSPSFNLNDPCNANFFTDNWIGQTWDTLTTEQQNTALYDHWVNFNVSTPFEPGSIFKPIVMAGALEEGAVAPDDTFVCNGQKVVAGQAISCWIASEGGAHGKENLTQVLSNSCNVGMMGIVEKMGRNLFFKYRNDFGFGEKTGIDLPAEEAVSEPYAMFSLDQLNPVELATSSFGQGFLATAIQDITAFSALINGGKLMKPHIVSQILDSSNNVLQDFEPQIIRRVISADTSDRLRVMLNAVVSPIGTGKNAMIEGYNIGGKTGTAQQITNKSYEEGKITLTFIAYLPVENPQFIALAVIDKPNESMESSVSAAPMMREMLEDIIKYKNIKPSDETAVTAINDGSIPMPDYTNAQLRDATQSLNSLGLNFICDGDGDIVKSQFPMVNQRVTPGSSIILFLKQSGAELVSVPDVTGQTPDAAIKALYDAELSAASVYSGPAPSAEADSAVPSASNAESAVPAAQAADSAIPAATAADSAVPATTGADSAVPAATGADSAIPAANAAADTKKVVKQMPDPGQKVQKGTEVKLIIS